MAGGKAGLPAWVRSTGDVELLKKYMADHAAELTSDPEALAFLQSQTKINEKIDSLHEEAMRRVEAELPFRWHAQTFGVRGSHGVVVSQPAFQSSRNGCWSCAFQMLLAARGVNLTQEEIRGFRPRYDETAAKAMDPGTQKTLNSDVVNDILESGDLVAQLLPNTMVRGIEIQQYGPKVAAKGIDEVQYVENASAVMRDVITRAITADHSPVALLANGHYITIVGIDGDQVYYKDSRATKDYVARTDPDETLSAKISELIATPIAGPNALGIKLEWLADLKLLPDGKTFAGVPSEQVQLQEDGSVSFPEGEFGEGALMETDERHQLGMTVRRFGDRDIPISQEYDDNAGFSRGVIMTQRAYIPKEPDVLALARQLQGWDAEIETPSKSVSEVIAERRRVQELQPDEVKRPDQAMWKFRHEQIEDYRRQQLGKAIFAGLSYGQIDDLLKVALEPEEYQDFIAKAGEAYSSFREKNGWMEQDELMQHRGDWLDPQLSSVCQNDDRVIRIAEAVGAHPELLPPDHAIRVSERIKDLRHVSLLTDGERTANPYHSQLEDVIAAIPKDHPQREALLASMKRADAMLTEPTKVYRDYLYNRSAAEQHLSFVEGQAVTAAADEGRPRGRVLPAIKGERETTPQNLREPALSVFQETRVRDFLAETVSRGDDYMEASRRILHGIEEMIAAKPDEKLAPEEGDKVYGFKKVLLAHDALAEAVKSGDPQAIMKAQQEADETYRKMHALMEDAKAHFAKGYHVVGNMDVNRTVGIPMEFMREEDSFAQSQVNGLYSCYVFCHNNGIAIDDFLREPDRYVAEDTVRKMEEFRPASQATTGSIGKNLAAMCAYSEDYEKKSLEHRAVLWTNSRALDGLALIDPDPKTRAEQLLRTQALMEFTAKRGDQLQEEADFYALTQTRSRQQFLDRSLLYQTIAVADRQDIDYTRIGMTGYTELGGNKPPFSIDAYILDKNRHFDYDEIRERTTTTMQEFSHAAINAKVYHPERAAAEMLLGAQEAHIKMLLLRQQDRHDPGYQALEQHVLHIMETPEAATLSGQRKDRMEDLIEFYKQADKKIEKTAGAMEKKAHERDAAVDKGLKSLLEQSAALERKIRLGEDKAGNTVKKAAIDKQISENVGARREELKKAYREGEIPESYLRLRSEQLYSIEHARRMPDALPPFYADAEERHTFAANRAMKLAGFGTDIPVDQTALDREYRMTPYAKYQKQAVTYAVENDMEASLFEPARMVEMERVLDELSAKKGGIFSKDPEKYTELVEATRELYNDMRVMYDPKDSPKGRARDEQIVKIASGMHRVQELARDYARSQVRDGEQVRFKQTADERRYLAALDLEKMIGPSLQDYDRHVQEEYRILRENEKKKSTAKPVEQTDDPKLEEKKEEKKGVKRPLNELEEIEELEHPKKKQVTVRQRSRSVSEAERKTEVREEKTGTQEAPPVLETPKKQVF
ncbi:MAG: hypothetical protein K6G16_08080 [Lachnospiraceae bacterium]|nr:hypothetical protein [Lachnospiraceae bacterium]